MTGERRTDKKTIGLTAEGKAAVEQVLGIGLFKDQLDLARFAMALALKDNSAVGYVEGADTTWNVGSFDPSGEIKGILSAFYPGEETPYRLAESLIDVGLKDIKSRLAQQGTLDVVEILKPDSQPGTTFGEYELLNEFPAGMGEAFRALHRPSNEHVFLKRVKIGPTVDAAALEREAAVYQKIQRERVDGVLRVRDYGRQDGYVYLVCEFADGGDLSGFIHLQPGKKLRPADAKAITIEVATALRDLHGRDIVHRDLKPANILKVAAAWKLGDFGIAKNLNRLITQRTFQQAGTLGFSAPEQMDGVEAHPSADIYSLGKIMIYLLTGQTDIDFVQFPAWKAVIARCVDQNRGNRPSAADLLGQIGAIQV